MTRIDGNSLPMVSVVMPAYNAEKYIKETIESVQKQTVSNWELIIVDDCSSDQTRMIIQEIQKKDERIKLLVNAVNLGVAKTRNRGFDECKGQYVALLDSDDLWREDKLEKQLKVYEETEADIVYCSYALIDEDGGKSCNDFIVPEKADYELMLTKSVISCSTAMFKREVIEKYHFTEDYYHEDYVLWLTMLRDGLEARGTSEVLADYRQIENSRAANKVMCAMERWKIYRDYLNIPFTKSMKHLMQYALAGVQKYQKI